MFPFKRRDAPGPVNWKTNLVVVWISQLVSLSAFSFCLPFLPLHLKEHNIVPPDETAFWSGVLISAVPVSMMIMAPIWGILGDRYGHKVMLVRATVSGAFCVYFMAFADSIWTLILLRLLQGVFTGTVPSAQSLVAATTPDRYQGFALGLMMAALGASTTLGSFTGGIYASNYGTAATFEFAGYLLLGATILVALLVRENPIPPRPLTSKTRSARVRRLRTGAAQLWGVGPILLGIALLAVLQTYDSPFLPLYVEALYSPGMDSDEVAAKVFRLTGDINAIASLLAVAGSMSISYLMDRDVPKPVWAGLGLAAAGGVGVVYWWGTLVGLTTGRSVFLFFTSGLAAILVVMMSRMTPPEKRGSAMGWAFTARSVGWVLAPLTGAHAANVAGYAGAYWWLGVASLLLAPLFLWLTWRYAEVFGKKDDGPDRPAGGELLEQKLPSPESVRVVPR